MRDKKEIEAHEKFHHHHHGGDAEDSDDFTKMIEENKVPHKTKDETSAHNDEFSVKF